MSARWVLPVVTPPIEHGAVLVEDGRIVGVGPDRALPRPPSAEVWDLGEAVLLPGLVNTHAHLELTALRGLVRALPFADWIRTLRHITDALSADTFRASSRWGVLEHFAAGITTIGDTGSSRAPAIALAELHARGIAYHEVFGPDPARVGEALRGLEEALDALWPYESARVRIGVSPHAPYTVSDELLRAVVALARRRERRVAMHVAESREETLLVERGDGPFAEALRRRGIAVTAHGVTPVAWAARGGLLELEPLLIHCVTAGEEDFRFMARHRAAVAHCPWSNATLGHGRANLAAMRAHGLTVGVGTDSVAAGGAIDLFAEARFAALGCPLTPREMLRLITLDAAAALGVEGAGALAPGAWGDLAAVALAAPGFAGLTDPEEAIATCATAADVRFTWVAGRMMFKRLFWPGVDVEAERAAFVQARTAAAAAAAATGNRAAG